ncbi:hypothetical protein AHAS_Ahas13G0364000 [Arachis hypogaea]
MCFYSGTMTPNFGKECTSESGVQYEMIFPSSFFTVMVHLTVHLFDEVTLGGPVHYRWMYPIERYLGRLKQYVHIWIILRLESTDQGRIDDEPVDVLHNSGESMFLAIGKALGAVSHFELTPMEKHQAHHHVLVNCDAVVPFVDLELVLYENRLHECYVVPGSYGKYASFERLEVACVRSYDSGKTFWGVQC